ncbi:hypothetical protein [Nocardioides sp.]|uniref:hypothetical protein n=1 Tax=Nocardioides sp. TaxID=35761 RepID=UPI002733D762|nr:hypothetical protein [Nocardioides sp.]MDP3890752.1 hypothetical protein [Nocardioides sp.]
MAAVVWVLAGTAVAVLVVVAAHHTLVRGRGGSGTADALGNFIDVFDPGRARAARDLKDWEHTGPVIPSPDDDDEAPVRLVHGPDGRPRKVRLPAPRRGH